MKTLEFFLNRAELSLNSANSGNLKITEAWIGLNLKILSLHVSCWNCGSILVSHRRGGYVAGSSPFIVMTNILSVKHLGRTPLHFSTTVAKSPWPKAITPSHNFCEFVSYHVNYLRSIVIMCQKLGKKQKCLWCTNNWYHNKNAFQ